MTFVSTVSFDSMCMVAFSSYMFAKNCRPSKITWLGSSILKSKTRLFGSVARSVVNSLASQLGGGIEHGADDLIVAGAPAEVAGEPVARLGLRRARIAVQQGFGGDQQARRAEAALQGRVLQEFPLQRMEIMAARHALDRLDGAAFGLDRKHQARADQAAVDGHAAGAAITRAASLLAAGQMQLVAQHIQQGELRLAQKLSGLAVDPGRYVMLAHRRFPARS